MKRKTVYKLYVDRVTKKYDAIAQRGYEEKYVHGDYSFNVCYMSYGQGWMSAIGGVMCTTGNTLAACKDRTTNAIADMIARGRLAELLALPMVLDDILACHYGWVTYKEYTALRKKYMEIAEGMLNA